MSVQKMDTAQLLVYRPREPEIRFPAIRLRAAQAHKLATAAWAKTALSADFLAQSKRSFSVFTVRSGRKEERLACWLPPYPVWCRPEAKLELPELGARMATAEQFDREKTPREERDPLPRVYDLENLPGPPSGQAWRSAAEIVSDIVLSIDPRGTILSANRALPPHTVDETIGTPCFDSVARPYRRRFRDAVDRAAETGEPCECEFAGLETDGQISRYRATILPLKLAAKVSVLTLIVTDLSAREHLERTVREWRQELNAHRTKMVQLEKSASLGTCSAMLSHQLNEPLTVVRLALEYSLESLESVPCPQAVTEQLEAALRGASKIETIAREFRRFARQGVLKTRGEVDLNAVAHHTVRLFDKPGRRAKTVLHVQGFDALAPVTLKGDIEQLFFALTENAIQAADGKHPHKVTISGALRDGTIELRFSDDCDGITREDQKRIFEPFFTTKPPRVGTGLGLCVAQHIVAENSGRIHVESIPGEGTTFIVSLPTGQTMKDETEG